jgi:hypothetical protein
MPDSRKYKLGVLLASLAVFVSRLPFIFDGYGSEEDAWGLILTAREISRTGIYEVSRMPGHPLQELLLSLIWTWPAWLLNLMTAAASAAGIYFFIRTLRKWDVRHSILTGLALGFTPVYFMHSVNIMDYVWAISLVMVSMYFISTGRMIWAGVLLGLAVGFRITSGAMLIPFCIFLLYSPEGWKNCISLVAATVVVGLICYLPVIHVYGGRFFTYYEYFPYPPVLKNIYKATIGPLGVAGFFTWAVAALISLRVWFTLSRDDRRSILPYVTMAMMVVILFVYAYIRIPQKTAFIIPILPFLLLLFSLLLNRTWMMVLVGVNIISCFFLGVNLDDPYRGSGTSAFAYPVQVGDISVVVDPFVGPVNGDRMKREKKIQFALDIAQRISDIQDSTIVIAGWWQNEVRYFLMGKENALVKVVYYEDENFLRDHLNKGWNIFFLPEQDYWNDVRFSGNFTKEMARPFVVE